MEAGAKIQSSHARIVWDNSSVKNIPQELCSAVEKSVSSKDKLQIVPLNESLERLSVVLTGIKQYVSPNIQERTSKLPKEEAEELNNRFESVFDISNFEKFMTESNQKYAKEQADKDNKNYYSNSKKRQGNDDEKKSDAIKSNLKNSDLNSTYDILHLELGKMAGNVESNDVKSKTKANDDHANFSSTNTIDDLKSNPSNFENIDSAFTNIIIDEIKEDILQSKKNGFNIPILGGKIDESLPPITDSNVVVKAQTSKARPKAKQKLSDVSKQRAVPSTRISRVFAFGSLAAGLGIGTATEYAKSVLKGPQKDEEPSLGGMFLSPANAERIVNTLCKVRGAALKIGQLLSLQDESVISPELQKIFERVRQSADFMPKFQVEKMMTQELGYEWKERFATFEDKPFAAASIGQVHLATLHDGTEVAVKIQYPGVAKGINSDIDNLVSVLNVWNIFPKGLFIDNIVEVAKKELAWEVDYVREADCTDKFRTLLQPFEEYYVPRTYRELCTKQVLTTELIEGLPLDKCFNMDINVRQDIANKVMNLVLHEMFVFRCMQTDPNWSNFFYNPTTSTLVLLDFGATREYSKEFIDKYIEIIKAASERDTEKVLTMSRQMKFLTGYETKVMEQAHVETTLIMAEIFTPKDGNEFDFGAQNTSRRLQKLVPTILNHRLCPPPEEIYSLHRKLTGVFLLCAKLKVKVNCKNMFEKVYKDYEFGSN